MVGVQIPPLMPSPLAQRLERTPYKRVTTVRLYHGLPTLFIQKVSLQGLLKEAFRYG